jgi:hypothetical protein
VLSQQQQITELVPFGYAPLSATRPVLIMKLHRRREAIIMPAAAGFSRCPPIAQHSFAPKGHGLLDRPTCFPRTIDDFFVNQKRAMEFEKRIKLTLPPNGCFRLIHARRLSTHQE